METQACQGAGALSGGPWNNGAGPRYAAKPLGKSPTENAFTKREEVPPFLLLPAGRVGRSPVMGQGTGPLWGLGQGPRVLNHQRTQSPSSVRACLSAWFCAGCLGTIHTPVFVVSLLLAMFRKSNLQEVLTMAKHLSLDDRSAIRNGLDRGDSFKQIGRDLGKDCTTIPKR